MIRFYHRRDERLRYEVRLAADGDGYDLLIFWPGGRETVEAYSSLDRVLRREHELHCAWVAQGWTESTRQ